jgi:hypothetical protein
MNKIERIDRFRVINNFIIEIFRLIIFIIMVISAVTTLGFSGYSLILFPGILGYYNELKNGTYQGAINLRNFMILLLSPLLVSLRIFIACKLYFQFLGIRFIDAWENSLEFINNFLNWLLPLPEETSFILAKNIY